LSRRGGGSIIINSQVRLSKKMVNKVLKERKGVSDSPDCQLLKGGKRLDRAKNF
jgi:hypothetical protein